MLGFLNVYGITTVESLFDRGFMKTSDTVKDILGTVYLNKCEYKGKRVVSENRDNTVLERQYEFAPNGIKDS